MQLATFQPPGRQQPLAGAVDGDRITAFADGATVVDVLAGRSPDLDSDSWPLSEVTLLAPVPGLPAPPLA